ncbi:phage tail sheath protein [Cohnella pontilimi]|uniref:Phage tail sheath protein n=1 Tax=Cohnella pontilimi TaxID=2564100 RepID=A0A4U0FCV6_9BACL|nr:phage tail sheath protein [Cohnella pontilimi]TJY42635.1 phage tail sheath protein [Cohnella pontilimi]
MSLIIPGVEIRVIRELVPRPLGATGVLGIVGCTEIDRRGETLQAFGSLQEFRDKERGFGAGSLAAMPEVQQAFAAGLNQVVVANIPDDKAVKAKAEIGVTAGAATAKVEFSARAGGEWGNRIAVRAFTTPVGDGADELVEVQVFYPFKNKDDKPAETFRNLSGRNDHDRYFVKVINEESAFLRAALKPFSSLPTKVLPTNNNPQAAQVKLTHGSDPEPADYIRELERLEAFAEIDMVTVSHRYTNADKATAVYAEVLSHCERMSKIARNRIGFGQLVENESEAKKDPDIRTAQKMASRLPSNRFVLVAPNGYLGSVIGMIAGLRYFESPTFKTLGGVSELTFDFTDSNLIALISSGVCAVDELPRKGIAVVKGISTDSEQINVTRVADRAVRQVQNIAQDFIGLLNTEEQRLALRQRINEAFTRMEKEGAIVKSTGKNPLPAFAVSVESLPDDFAAGIVRIDTAIRPVRAIDYIYATLKVQAF